MQEILEQAGLSKNEALVYLVLSRIGLSSSYKIAHEANIYKQNAIEALHRLRDKGLIAEQHANRHKLYAASDPSLILNILDQKRERINSIIPSLRLQQKSTSIENTFEQLKGADALVSILTQWLEYKQDILVWGAPKTAYQLLGH